VRHRVAARLQLGARLHLPWLPFRVRIVRDLFVLAAVISLPIAALAWWLLGWDARVVAASVGLPLFGYLLYGFRTMLGRRPPRRPGRPPGAGSREPRHPRNPWPSTAESIDPRS
jgi:hypothetical protein